MIMLTRSLEGIFNPMRYIDLYYTVILQIWKISTLIWGYSASKIRCWIKGNKKCLKKKTKIAIKSVIKEEWIKGQFIYCLEKEKGSKKSIKKE